MPQRQGQSAEYGSVAIGSVSDLLEQAFEPLYALWTARRPEGGTPSFRSFDVLDLPPAALVHMIVAKRTADGDYHYLVSGSEVDANNGFPIRERLLSEIGIDRDGILANEFDRTLESGTPRCSWGHFLVGDWNFKNIMRITCPFADGDGVPRFVVGMVLFKRFSERLGRTRAETGERSD